MLATKSGLASGARAHNECCLGGLDDVCAKAERAGLLHSAYRDVVDLSLFGEYSTGAKLAEGLDVGMHRLCWVGSDVAARGHLWLVEGGVIQSLSNNRGGHGIPSAVLRATCNAESVMVKEVSMPVACWCSEERESARKSWCEFAPR